ncbi:hypothetical protein [Paracoccus ravus]|uniref:hypothetical protein n=1 Tax=Paracoccus ravus TaxID=2447760 RepID=UPI00142FF20C|nr:hypothetical protein [Paracoccus ravus]
MRARAFRQTGARGEEGGIRRDPRNVASVEHAFQRIREEFGLISCILVSAGINMRLGRWPRSRPTDARTGRYDFYQRLQRRSGRGQSRRGWRRDHRADKLDDATCAARLSAERRGRLPLETGLFRAAKDKAALAR